MWDQCNVPVSSGNQGEVPVSGLSGEFGSTCVVDGPNTVREKLPMATAQATCGSAGE